MEVSVTGNSYGYELTDAAKHLVEQLVVLDSASRADKEVLFEQLYELWKQDLAIGAKADTQFTTNKQFIEETIFHSLSAKEQEKHTLENNIYENIKNGIKYTLPDKVIESNYITIKEFKSQVRNNKRKISRRFDSLLKEFVEFVEYKKHDKPDSILYAPYTPPAPTRESLVRVAKDQALLVIEGYAGSASSSNPEGKKRKKGNKENADGPDESEVK